MISLPDIAPSTALLIVDLQRGFINGHTAHLPSRIESAQALYPVVVAVRFHNAETSPYRKWMGWNRFEADADETALAFACVDHATIHEKTAYTAALPDVIRRFADEGIETVHIAGCDTNACVMTTAVDLFQGNRFRPVVLAPLCASHSGPSYHEQALSLLEKLIGSGQIWDGS